MPYWKRTEIQASLFRGTLSLSGIQCLSKRHVPGLAQDVMAYLRLVVGLRDELALLRVINTPRYCSSVKPLAAPLAYTPAAAAKLTSALLLQARHWRYISGQAA